MTSDLDGLLRELLRDWKHLSSDINRLCRLVQRSLVGRTAETRLLLSKREAAKLLAIDRGATLDALIRSGALRAVRKNGRLAVPLTEVQRLGREGFDVHGRARRRHPRTRPSANKPVSAWKLKI